MSNEDLLIRQQRLLAQSEQLRGSLATQAQLLSKPLALADKLQSGLLWLYQHPQWPVAIVCALAVLRPRRAVAWATRLWWGWNSFRRLQKWIESALSSR